MHYHTAETGSDGAWTWVSVCDAVCAWDQPWSGRWIISEPARNYVRVRLAYQVAGRRATHARTHVLIHIHMYYSHTHTDIGGEQQRYRGVSALTRSPFLLLYTLHNLGIIYISPRAIISGPGRAHRVSDKFEPSRWSHRSRWCSWTDHRHCRQCWSWERYDGVATSLTGLIDEWRASWIIFSNSCGR